MRRWVIGLFIAACLVASSTAAMGAHKPFYKESVDHLEPGTWEAHFIWLRSDYFNYMGNAWWQVIVDTPGRVDILFLDLRNFEAFRAGGVYSTLLDPLLNVADGSQYISGLTADLPYFLVLRNTGTAIARVNWTIFADIDWRRWQGEPPGPEWNLTVVRSSGAMNLTDSWETTFDDAAVYVYYCLPHVDMTGIVEVVDSNETPDRVDVTIHDMGFHPEVIRIPVGSTVNWTNLDNMTHSVNLGLLPGGFIIPAATPAPPSFLVLSVVAITAVGAFVAGLLVLRRRRLALEGTSKTSRKDRTEGVDRNKHK